MNYYMLLGGLVRNVGRIYIIHHHTISIYESTAIVKFPTETTHQFAFEICYSFEDTISSWRLPCFSAGTHPRDTSLNLLSWDVSFNGL